MTDRYESRATTHADNCWSWGPAHYGCAVREIERLRAEVERDRALLQQALEALDSGHPDIQLRTAIALRKRLEEQSWPPNRERLAETANDLARCPNCGGPADNGHDREVPPNPYWCSKCTES